MCYPYGNALKKIIFMNINLHMIKIIQVHARKDTYIPGNIVIVYITWVN